LPLTRGDQNVSWFDRNHSPTQTLVTNGAPV
jgi:hypothetical protein